MVSVILLANPVSGFSVVKLPLFKDYNTPPMRLKVRVPARRGSGKTRQLTKPPIRIRRDAVTFATRRRARKSVSGRRCGVG